MTGNTQLRTGEQDRAALLRERLRSPITREQFAVASLEEPATGVSQEEVLALAFVRQEYKPWMTRELAELFWKAVKVLANPTDPPASGAVS